MARTARTHKETVRPDFTEAERPQPAEEDGSWSSSPEGAGEEDEGDVPAPDPSETDSEVVYDDTFEVEVPREEGVLEPATPPDLSTVDFGQFSQYHSVVALQEANEVIRRYPFRPRYSIYPPQGHQTAEWPPRERVVVYLISWKPG